VCKILVGNKNDKEDREVKTEDGQELANQFNMPFLETSAKSAAGVQEAFEMMTQEIKKKYGQGTGTGGKTTATTNTGAGRSLQYPQANNVDEQATVNLQNM
jgi:GTPase SAR1 family protein